MGRLSAFERQRELRVLASWQAPSSMRAKVEALRDHLGERCLTDAGMGFWRDAYCVVAFGELRRADRVRLMHPELRPDLEALIAGKVQTLEVTEADYSERRRGDEYREHGGHAYGFEPMDPELAWTKAEGYARFVHSHHRTRTALSRS